MNLLKKKTALDRVNEVFNGIQSQIDTLTLAAAELRDEREILNQRRAVLNTAIDSAGNLARNLKELF